MTLIFRYILRQYVSIYLLCLVGLTSIYLIVDFFEKLRKFLRYDAQLSSVFLYFFYKIPEISFTLSPMVALMATVLTLGIFSKNREITAFRSCGFSLWHITAPFWVVGVAVTLLLYSLTAVVIPLANSHAEFIRTVEIQKKPRPVSFASDTLWLRMGNRHILNIDEVHPDGLTLNTIRLYELDDSFHLHTILDSPRAHYQNGWILETVTERRLLPNGRVSTTSQPFHPIDLRLTPVDFKKWLSLKPSQMTFEDLEKYIRRLEEDGHSSVRPLTDYWGRTAFALVSLVMTFLGVALGLLKTESRTPGLAKGIGQALGISLLFWTLHSVGIALGRSGAVPPIVGGWIAMVILFIISLNLFLKVRY